MTTRNKAVALTLQNPRQQSGQKHIQRVYKSTRALKRLSNTVTIQWLPLNEEHDLIKLAKEKVKATTEQGCTL